MNKVILIGRLTKDPETRRKEDGTVSVSKFSLAVTRKYKPKDGGPDADFLNCIAFGRLAETCEKYLRKGNRVGIIGSIVTGSYTNKENRKVYTTDIYINELEFLENKSESKQETLPETNTVSTPTVSGKEEWLTVPDGIDDELPF